MNAILNLEARQAINFKLEFKHARLIALLIQGLALSIAAFFFAFAGGNALAEAIVSPIGHLDGLAEAAGLVAVYTCLASIPVIFYLGHKKTVADTLSAVILLAFILGIIFSAALL